MFDVYGVDLALLDGENKLGIKISAERPSNDIFSFHPRIHSFHTSYECLNIYAEMDAFMFLGVKIRYSLAQ